MARLMGLLVAILVSAELSLGEQPVASSNHRTLKQILKSPADGDAKALFEATGHTDPRIRRAAVMAYAKVSGLRDSNYEFSKSELATFRQLLLDPDAGVRLATIGCMRSQVGPQMPLLREIVSLLRDKDAGIRETALYALFHSGEPIESAFPELESIANENASDGHAELAMRTLVRWQQTDRVNRLLNKVSASVRAAAASDASWDLLMILLRDKDVEVRERAVANLGSWAQSHSEDVRNEVLKALGQTDYRILDAAVENIGPGDRSGFQELPDLKLFLKAVSQTDPEWLGRKEVWSKIRTYDRPEVQNGLMELVEDQTADEGLRAEALAVLTDEVAVNNDDQLTTWVTGWIADAGSPVRVRLAAIRIVQTSYNDDFTQRIAVPDEPLVAGLAPTVPLPYREIAAKVLAMKHPKAAQPILSEKCRDTTAKLAEIDPNQSGLQFNALVDWADVLLNASVQCSSAAEGWPLIRVASKSQHVGLRESAAKAIETVGEQDRQEQFDRQVLHTLITDQEQSVRDAVLQSLYSLSTRAGSDRAGVIADDLIAALQDDSKTWFKDYIAKILARCGAAAAPAFPELMNRFALLELQAGDDLDDSRWRFFLSQLVEIFPDEPAVIAAVRRAFERDDTRDDSFELVIQMGPRMSMLLPDLLGMIESPSPDERAIRAIGGLRRFGQPATAILETHLKNELVARQAAMALLQIDPLHHAAGSLVTEGAVEEAGQFWCFTEPPCLTFLDRQGPDGIIWLIEGLRGNNVKKVPHLASHILWRAERSDADWFRPAIREIAVNASVSDELRRQALKWLGSHPNLTR